MEGAPVCRLNFLRYLRSYVGMPYHGELSVPSVPVGIMPSTSRAAVKMGDHNGGLRPYIVLLCMVVEVLEEK